MLRGIHGDPQRYKEVYWSRFDGLYFPGDGCKLDEEGYLWLLGRVDDVMLVSGHNISTTEVESALVDHHGVAESAVVGRKDDTTGQAIAAFVVLKGGSEGSEVDSGVATACRSQNWPHRQACQYRLHSGFDEDPIRQNHETTLAGYLGEKATRGCHHSCQLRYRRGDSRRSSPEFGRLKPETVFLDQISWKSSLN